jgi:SAM-dependent methyltransferase
VNESAVARVDPSNREQAKAWDGDEGEYWTAHAARFDRSLAAYHRPFLDAAAIGPHERVLDVGCGTGQTTRDAARAAASGSALGVDLSSRMIDLARQLAVAEELTNARFEQADAQVHPFAPSSFDVAISRTGAMFFGDPVAAFANIGRSLRPAGRLVLLTWQPPPGNEWIREFSSAMAAGRDLPMPPPDAPGPFSFADPDRVRSILTSAGFVDVELEGASRGMWFGENADDVYQFILGLLGWMLEGLDDAGRALAGDSLRSSIEAHQTPQGVVYESATWTIHAIRT